MVEEKERIKQENQHFSEIHRQLESLRQNLLRRMVGRFAGSGPKLTGKTCELGLLLINALPEYRGKKPVWIDNDNTHWFYRENVDYGDARLDGLKRFGDPSKLWEGEHFALLEYLFGDKAPYVKQAWYAQTNLPYSKHWERRSFRAPHQPQLNAVQQMNFLIDLIPQLQPDRSLGDWINENHKTLLKSPVDYVLGAALDHDSTLVNHCIDAVMGRHETAKTGAGIIKAMLLSHQTEAWQAVEQLLLAAQRQEGLRQSIVETLDEAHVGALKYFIGVILEHNLGRFSSVVRAVDVWMGLGWEKERGKVVNRVLEEAHLYLNQPEQIVSVMDGKDTLSKYVALWAAGTDDIDRCRPMVKAMLDKGGRDNLLLALYFSWNVGLSSFGLDFGKRFVDYPDLAVSTLALNCMNDKAFIKLLPEKEKKEVFHRLKSFVEKETTKEKKFEGILFSWLTIEYKREAVFNLIVDLLRLEKKSDLELVLPMFSDLPLSARERVVWKVMEDYCSYGYDDDDDAPPKPSAFQIEFAFRTLRDPSTTVKQAAVRALTSAPLSDSEIQLIEELLQRKSADFRKLIMRLLVRKGEPQVRKSAERLISSKSVEQRLAGLDLLLHLKQSKNTESAAWASAKAEAFASERKPTQREQTLLDNLINNQATTLNYTWENGLGLFDPKNIAPPEAPKAPKKGVYVDATRQQVSGFENSASMILKALEDLKKLYQAHSNHEYTFEDWSGEKHTVLLANQFSELVSKSSEHLKGRAVLDNYPLSEIWDDWYQKSGLSSRDLFLLSLGIVAENRHDSKVPGFQGSDKETKSLVAVLKLPNPIKNEWLNPTERIIRALESAYPYEQEIDYLGGLFSAMLSAIPNREVSKLHVEKSRWGQVFQYTWRELSQIKAVHRLYSARALSMTDEQFKLFWRLDEWYYKTVPIELTNRLDRDCKVGELFHYIRAFDLGLCHRDELYSRLLSYDAFLDLSVPQRRKEHKEHLQKFPFVDSMFIECRERVLDIELKRGDRDTEVTQLAQNIHYLESSSRLMAILKGLGKENLHRGFVYSYGSTAHNKKVVFSSLLKHCFPQKNLTIDDFTQKIKENKITDQRLVEVASYAPQWIPWVEQYLKWEGLRSGVWWYYAHANTDQSAEQETEIARFSSIHKNDFQDGAVDIDWFAEAYGQLGKSKWVMLHKAAKYVSDGTGHKRAQLYADVILGNVKIKEVTERVAGKRNQDYLRVYGLVPLSKRIPEKDLLNRYEFIQQFKKESKDFGAQKQASEALAVRIALENLARTAGYRDPLRLTWAMETTKADQIMGQSKVELDDEVHIELQVNEQGEAHLVVLKGEKLLKSIPAKYKKHKEVERLRSHQKTLREQYRRSRVSLEQAMVNGDAFTTSEFENLLSHPVLAPMLSQLVLVSDGKVGFYHNGNLKQPSGNTVEITSDLRIAHGCDLHASGLWGDFQAYCFEHKIKQAFKQIFRELYMPTQGELEKGSISNRYEGHQVQPSKAVALLKSRGWTVNYEEGLQKVFHKEGFIVQLYAMADWFSPADVESPTLESVHFFKRASYDAQAIKDLETRLFSEIMRDLDLVVSVAHVGDVDPEASHSSIEMRKAIAKETAKLFKIKDIEFGDRHVTLKGKLGSYSLHLGSGTVHVLPGTSVAIIPVHSQHRGRLFLPFVDDDPKTAEILSKMLLLAKDDKIQDPTILAQITR